MIPAKFDYVAPTSVEDALSALAQHGDDAKIMAGGQSLLPVLRMRLNAPEVVIDLGRIDGLRGVREDGDALVIGALTTHSEMLDERPGPPARAAAVEGGRRGGRQPDPAPRHLRRRVRPRGPGRRHGCGGVGVGRRVRDRRVRRHAVGAGVGVLRRPVRDRDRRGRDPHRDPGAQEDRLGRPLREVRPRRPPVADRRGRGDRERVREARSARRRSRSRTWGRHLCGPRPPKVPWPAPRRPRTARTPKSSARELSEVAIWPKRVCWPKRV